MTRRTSIFFSPKEAQLLFRQLQKLSARNIAALKCENRKTKCWVPWNPPYAVKGGYAHSNMHIFHFQLIYLDLWNAFCEVSPWGSFLFTLQRQKKVCTPGDEAIMKIHKKLFSGIPFNLTLFVISPKLQRIWSWNFGFAIRKIWAFIWYQKIYYFWLSPGGWECDQHKGL